MDVDSRKKEIDTVVGAKILMSREELMKQFLMPPTPIMRTIDGEIIDDVKQLTDSQETD